MEFSGTMLGVLTALVIADLTAGTGRFQWILTEGFRSRKS